MKNLLAENLGPPLEGIGPLSKPGDIGNAANLFNQTISIVVGVLTVSAGIWFIFQFFIGAFGWVTSGGDKAKLQEARSRIVQSIIGLVVVIAGIFIIQLIGSFLGLDILKPGEFVINVWGK